MSIVLNMIVKNEEHCIERALNSIKDYIDSYVICDTGSTDNTINKIKKVMTGIPGEIHLHEWKNFEINRNKALEIAKTKGDYVLFLDADDYFQINNKDPFKNINGPGYTVQIHHGSIKYSRINLINSKKPSKYIGALHEYLEIQNGNSFPELNTCKIIFGADGARSRNPSKYKEDALLLEKAIEKDPDNTRNIFYCAQSYRDCNDYKNALRLYLKRSNMGGYIDEKFISLLNIGRLLCKYEPNNNQIENIFISAFNHFPHRAESLVDAASYLNNKKEFHRAYLYSKLATTIPMPTGLFVEPAAYNWKSKDQLSISSYYIGLKQQSKKLMNELLNEVPETHKIRIQKNIESLI